MELVVRPLVSLIAGLAIAAGIGLTVWWLVAVHGAKDRSEEYELPRVDLPAHLHEVETGIPLVLVILYVLLGISMLAYVFSVWGFGVSY